MSQPAASAWSYAARILATLPSRSPTVGFSWARAIRRLATQKGYRSATFEVAGSVDDEVGRHQGVVAHRGWRSTELGERQHGVYLVGGRGVAGTDERKRASGIWRHETWRCVVDD